MRRSTAILTITLLAALSALVIQPGDGAAAQAADVDLLLILDASGSMWGQIDGENKIVIARRVLGDLIDGLSADSEGGLVAYGHRREGDCEDIETILPLGPLDKAAMRTSVEGLNPKGRTPITRAVNEAFEGLRQHPDPALVILVSDGLETCGGDPCAAVREARASGIDFVMHVVGFGVEGEEQELAQLECMAQAGGGQYFDVNSADALGAALESAVAAPAEIPDGGLVLKAVADGELTDVGVSILDAATGADVSFSRTYRSPATNPRTVPLEDGTYDVRVRALELRGNTEQAFQLTITDGGIVQREVDFSSGEIAIEVLRNGELSDATVNVYSAGTTDRVAGGRSYTREASNPAVYRLTPGVYDIAVGSVEISGRPSERIESIVVQPGERTAQRVSWDSGVLRIGARDGADLVDAVVNVRDASGQEVARGRTYTSDSSNPNDWVLLPGIFTATVREVGGERRERRFEITLGVGDTAERIIDFAAGRQQLD